MNKDLKAVLLGQRPWHIEVAEAAAAINALPADSVHCVVTSPPYHRMRDYDTDDQIGSEWRLDCMGWARSWPPCRDCYVCSLRRVAIAIQWALRPDGTFWLNIGDGFSSVGGTSGNSNRGNPHADAVGRTGFSLGVKRKNACMAPARVALALQADGWHLRSEIVWSKSSPMPNPVTDRPNVSHEMIYLFTKSEQYYYDVDAERVPVAESTKKRDQHSRISAGKDGPYAVQHNHETPSNPAGRNLWTVWGDIPTRNFGWRLCESCDTIYSPVEFRALPVRDDKKHVCRCGLVQWFSHFAVFPLELPERCIRLGTSAAGCCSSCGTPVGKQAGCSCQAPATPCLVLDPFSGSGTTVLSAVNLGRRGLGFDLNARYVAISRRRVREESECVELA